MKPLHYVYLKHVLGELEHDAIMKQAQKCGVDSVKKFLNMIVRFEVERSREEFIKTLSGEELLTYQDGQINKDAKLDEEIPF